MGFKENDKSGKSPKGPNETWKLWEISEINRFEKLWYPSSFINTEFNTSVQYFRQ